MKVYILVKFVSTVTVYALPLISLYFQQQFAIFLLFNPNILCCVLAVLSCLQPLSEFNSTFATMLLTCYYHAFHYILYVYIFILFATYVFSLHFITNYHYPFVTGFCFFFLSLIFFFSFIVLLLSFYSSSQWCCYSILSFSLYSLPGIIFLLSPRYLLIFSFDILLSIYICEVLLLSSLSLLPCTIEVLYSSLVYVFIRTKVAETIGCVLIYAFPFRDDTEVAFNYY